MGGPARRGRVGTGRRVGHADCQEAEKVGSLDASEP